MDFFAAGGFQQLFCDLNEQQTEYYHVMDATCALDDFAQMKSFSDDSCHRIDSYADAGPEPEPDDAYTFTHDLCNMEATTHLRDQYELLSVGGADPFVTAATTTLRQATHMIDSPDSSFSNNDIDCNNNVEREKIAYNEKQLQQSYDLLLLQDVGLTTCDMEVAADVYLTREMAEWEEKFLDNYVEIPELIDFLPEKTPLCTEHCEHFLQESSNNLKLYRNPKASYVTTSVEALEKGYPCNFGDCRKIYAKPAHLKAHLRRHMGEKPYICNWPDCTWKFSRSDELARHRRSHSGIKPYQCDYCNKCFARSDHLTKHRKVHERRMLAASRAGKAIDGVLPHSVYTVRPGRKRKNQIC